MTFWRLLEPATLGIPVCGPWDVGSDLVSASGMVLLGVALLAARYKKRYLSVALATAVAVVGFALTRGFESSGDHWPLALTPAAGGCLLVLALAIVAAQSRRLPRNVAVVLAGAVAGVCLVSLCGHLLGVHPVQEWGVLAGRLSPAVTAAALITAGCLIVTTGERLNRPLPLFAAATAILLSLALLGSRLAAVQKDVEAHTQQTIAMLAEAARLATALATAENDDERRMSGEERELPRPEANAAVRSALLRLRGLGAEKAQAAQVERIADAIGLTRTAPRVSGVQAEAPPADGATEIAALLQSLETRLADRASAVGAASHRLYVVTLAAATLTLVMLALAAVYAQRRSTTAMEASRLKSEFLASTSHEIRTSLNGVVGMLQMLDSPRLEQEHREQVHIALRSADALMRLLNDILDLSKIESGKLELEEIAFSPRQAFEEVQSLLRARAVEKGVGLRLEVDERIPPAVVGDPVRLKQVMLNLCANAIKFTDQGNVRLGLSCLGARASAVVLEFSVWDTGRGISPQAQRRLFGAFEQGDASTARKFGGSGLGLAISQRLVRQMGGEIKITSAPERGSRFWFELVLPLTDVRHLPAVAPANALRLRPDQRILVAEDDRVGRLVIEALLRKFGLGCTVAPDGAAVVEEALRSDWDLILMDMQMPKLDGLEATRQIRATGRLMPIVALTANVMPRDRLACERAGMDGFLAKPIREAELAQCLHRWLPAASLPSALASTNASV